MVRGNTDFGGLDVLADVMVLNICNTSGGWRGFLDGIYGSDNFPGSTIWIYLLFLRDPIPAVFYDSTATPSAKISIQSWSD